MSRVFGNFVGLTGTLSNLAKDLNLSFKTRYNLTDLEVNRSSASGPIFAKMACILFARPEFPNAESEIFSSLNYFHKRSGNYIDFYCAGFDFQDDLFKADEVGYFENYKAKFSVDEFNNFRKELENETIWKYSGEIDLILFSALHQSSINRTELNFSTALSINLAEALRIEAIGSISSFFEEIFQFAEEYGGTQPVWDFSDMKGFQISKNSLKQVFYSILPKSLREEAQKAESFIVSNISNEKIS